MFQTGNSQIDVSNIPGNIVILSMVNWAKFQ